ncbi:MAG: hypothetical protein JSV78_04360 [Phycisphaerales bacterium]|nr:MAG: hypothetical protein JSV78_04360 [Phycisphaerales bacterium]
MVRQFLLGGVFLSIVAAPAGPAQAAQIDRLTLTAIDVEALFLPDGEWLQGRDYGFKDLDVWMREHWEESIGSFVIHHVEMGMDGSEVNVPVTIHKDVTNGTDFFWDAFQVDLTPDPGSAIIGLTADPSPQFSSVTVADLADGSWSILWETEQDDPGVPIGQTVALDFQFHVDGDIAFKMRETPIPEPAAALLLTIGALPLFRRRSRAIRHQWLPL